MAEDKAPHTQEQQIKPRRLQPWRPTRRQILWAVGTLLALVTIALLVALLLVNLEAVKWEDLLSRERINLVALFIGISVALTALFVLLAIGGASFGWSGFGDKTFWDWLQLLSALAIPVVLAAAGLWFTAQQDARQQTIEDRRADQAQRIENQRAESEQEIEERRTQDAALQAYLDEMSSLMIGKNSLRNSEEDSEVRTLARARTLTVLGRLDPQRKTAVMQFLVEAKLVQKVDERPPLIGLSGADLSGAQLNDANLSGADLSYADLNDAYLSQADLSYANLSEAELRHASLSIGTKLNDARLSGADLSYANLSGEQIAAAQSLYNATMPDGQKYEDWLKSKGTADTTGTTTGTTGTPSGTTTGGTTGANNGGTNTTGASDGSTTGTSTTGASNGSTTGTSTTGTGAATNGGYTTSTNDRVMGNGKSGGSS